MKKSILSLLAVCVFLGIPVNAQVNRLLNKVSNSVTTKVAENSDSGSQTSNQEPEPKCACDQPEIVLDLAGKLKLMYSEITISSRDDGALLVKERFSGDFYIVKGGNPEGPIKGGDPKLAGFENLNDSDMPAGIDHWANNEYITYSGDKYTIKFLGKSYGPFGKINEFKVTKTKDKFAAIVVENAGISEADARKMDTAIKNAKTDQEKMDLSMQYSQMMMQKMQQGGGPNALLPKLVTNIPGTTLDPLESVGGTLNSNIKYDDILFTTYDKVIDLSNKVVLNLKSEDQGAQALFVNAGNTKYAIYKFGTLTFNDGKTMSDMFNLHLMKTGAQIYLAYMYYSPKKNAILKCKIPF
jgi:hypothetical protein